MNNNNLRLSVNEPVSQVDQIRIHNERLILFDNNENLSWYGSWEKANSGYKLQIG